MTATLLLCWLVAARAAAPAVEPGGGVGAAALSVSTDTLHRYLSRLEAFGFAGAAVVSRDREVLLARGYGSADPEADRPWTAATVTSVGSITKQFTAAAILALEERGRLSVDDSLPVFFADVPTDKRGITLHHLLTHTSGLREVREGDFDYVSRDASALVRGWMDGDWESVRSVTGDGPGARPFEGFWTRLEDQMGGAVGAEVLGTVPAWFHDESADVTWLRLRFERGVQIRRLHWRADGSLYGIGGQDYPAPLELRCASEASDRCVAFHLSLRTDAPRLRFQRGPRGRVSGLVVQTGSGETLEGRRD